MDIGINMKELQPFSVLGTDEESGQIILHHVFALDEREAFALVAKVIDMEMIACLKGHIREGHGIEFAGTAIVDSTTILDQPDVFTAENISDFYIDEDFNINPSWITGINPHSGIDESFLIQAYLNAGGRLSAINPSIFLNSRFLTDN